MRSIGRWRDLLRSSFWLVPASCAAAAVVVALALLWLDEAIGDVSSIYLFPGPPEGARSFLGAIIGAMISFTGLVFSITVVVLVLASGQFSPRVLRTFQRDRSITWALGVFVATFVYAMTVIRGVRGTDGHDAFVPRIAVTVAFVLVLASVVLFIHYINHVVRVINVSTIIAQIGEEARELIDRRCPADGCTDPVDLTGFGSAVELAAPRPGVVVSVAERAIVRRASACSRTVELLPRVGDFVPVGAPLLRVYGGEPDPGFAEFLVGQVAVAEERSMEIDLAFGFRQLVDIAVKALSPGINDPTTACQSVDVLHDLLRRFATRPPPDGTSRDEQEHVRLVVPQYTFAELLDLAVAEVWRYGGEDVQVPRRLAAMLADLASAARPEYGEAVWWWSSTVDRGLR